jgi:hypothetical protein
MKRRRWRGAGMRRRLTGTKPGRTERKPEQGEEDGEEAKDCPSGELSCGSIHHLVLSGNVQPRVICVVMVH